MGIKSRRGRLVSIRLKKLRKGKKSGTKSFTQWSVYGQGKFVPCFHTVKRVPSGVYELKSDNQIGFHIERQSQHSDELIELPIPEIQEILRDIDNFWKREEIFVKYGYTHKRGVLLYGPPGCHAKGTDILMYDGTLKKVEDVIVGDTLMGPDSKPREVLKLVRGRQEMVKIVPTKGNPFVVNIDHILSLKTSGEWGIRSPLNISVRNFLKETKVSQERYKLYRTGVSFPRAIEDSPIDPYILGLWLGDGHCKTATLCSADDEIIKAWKSYAEQNGMSITIWGDKKKKAKNYQIVAYHRPTSHFKYKHLKKRNIILDNLRTLNLMGNKHIPHMYLTASRHDRLKLLAGLIDTDGYVRQNTIYITSKYKHLAEQMAFLAKSLGFAANIKEYNKKLSYIRKNGETHYKSYAVTVYGDGIEDIPVLVQRKKLVCREQIKNPLVTGFKIETLPEDDYYGFVVDQDHLYLMGDFTVTHNCGKSCLIQLLCRKLVDEMDGIVFNLRDSDDIHLYLEYAGPVLRCIEPDRPIIVIMEDVDNIVHGSRSTLTSVLNMLDGIKQINKVVYVGTTNYPEMLQERISSRPSRFDRRYKIGQPNKKVRECYIKHKLKPEDLEKIDLKDWLNKTKGFSLAAIKELIVSVVILGIDLDEALSRLKEMKKKLHPLEEEGQKPVGFTISIPSDNIKMDDEDDMGEYEIKDDDESSGD